MKSLFRLIGVIVLLTLSLLHTACSLPDGGGQDFGPKGPFTLLSENDFPFVGAVLVYDAARLNIEKVCTGTLLAPTVVLTSASCLPSDGDPERMRFSRSADLNFLGSLVGVAGIRKHPHYDGTEEGYHNMALLDLAVGISLPEYPMLWLDSSGLVPMHSGTAPTRLSLVGYGLSGEGAMKRKIDVDFEGWYQNGDIYSSPTWLLALVKSGLQECLGDVGGPAILRDGGQYHIVGLGVGTAKFGDACEESAIYSDMPVSSGWVLAKAMELVVGGPGDTNLDGKRNVLDIDAVGVGLRATGGYDAALDVNNDGIVDMADADYLIHDIFQAKKGDFNLMWGVGAEDDVTRRNNEGATNAVYSQGDANLDGVVDAADRAVWMSNFGSYPHRVVNGDIAPELR